MSSGADEAPEGKEAIVLSPEEQRMLGTVWEQAIAKAAREGWDSLEGKVPADWIRSGDKAVWYMLTHIEPLMNLKPDLEYRVARVMVIPLVAGSTDKPFLLALADEKTDGLHRGLIVHLLGERPTSWPICELLVKLLEDRRKGERKYAQTISESERVCDIAFRHLICRLNLEEKPEFPLNLQSQDARNPGIAKLKEWWTKNAAKVKEQLEKDK
jgi:hypothetical protein